jgi:hypothetical protein
MGRRVNDSGGNGRSQPREVLGADAVEWFQAPRDLGLESIALERTRDGFVAEGDGRDAVEDRFGFVSIDVRHFGSLA